MSDETVTSFREGQAACPFVAFEDDRDHRSESPDYRHRCFASPEPEPRALPHQERFCLSATFAACPIFLDWARAEAAGVTDKSAAATGAGSPAATAAAVEPSPRPQAKTPDQTPAFLASRGRTTPAESTPKTAHAADPGSGLWGFEGAPRRTVAPATAPAKASTTSSTPAYSMARRQPSRPDWENPPRLDNFPRLRARSDRNNNQPLLLAALAVAALLVGLIVVPEITSSSGGGPTPSGSQLPSGVTPTPVDTPSPTPEAQQTFEIYTVRRGDNLTKIANDHNVTVAMIIAANLGTQFEIKNPDVLLVGQKMFIPWPTWVVPTEPPTASPTPVASGSTSSSPTASAGPSSS
jgi:LysM repeat protein